MKKTLLFLSLFSLLNAETINIILPKVPDVPKVTAKVPQSICVTTTGTTQTNAQIVEEATEEKKVHFSNHVAPVVAQIQDDANKTIKVGDITNGKVPAYLHSPLIAKSEIVSILKESGFTVLSSQKVDKKGIAYSIVFTNDAMIKLSSQKGRGFASTLHITIDKKNSLISITNPIYVMAAFMQNQYDKKIAEKTLATLRDAFKDLKNSDEMVKFRVLERYQFMAGMPQYGDMQILNKKISANLLKKLKKSKKIVYQQKLLNGSTIFGVKLSKRTTRFIKKIGYQNAGLLPYPVLVENGEVKILDPKYYIAVMYPKLKMSQFMTIATVPGAINKDIDRIFR